MATMTLNMKLLTPVHIGTGEDYEPTNFIIDDGFLYEFDETVFYHHLNDTEKQAFRAKVESTAPEALFEIHAFVKHHKEAAKNAAKLKVKVSDGIANDYRNKVGRAVQFEGWKKQKVFNRFQIPRTLRNPNTTYPYLPGSSIKGSLSTAIQEAFFLESESLYREFFEVRNPSQSFMKNLLISDARPLKIGTRIGYALNKERFEDDKEGPKNKIEVMVRGSEFEVSISTRDYVPHLTFSMEKLRGYSNDHYLPLFQSMMSSYNTFRDEKVDDFINEYFSDAFYDAYKDLTLNENQFLLRVGKHSGARAVSIEGLRQIKVRVSKRNWETLDQETTTWLFGDKETQTEGLLPFGWVLCTINGVE